MAPPLGLINTGVSCYQNAVLQALIYLPDFKQFFLNLKPHQLLPGAPRWISSLAKIVINYHKGNSRQLDIFYLKFQEDLVESGLFSQCNQEDASELVTVLMSKLTESFNYGEDHLNPDILPQIHPLVKYFTFISVDSSIKTENGRQSVTNLVYPSQILNLGLPPYKSKDTPIELTSLLDNLKFATEIVPGRVQAKTLHQLPKYLILVLDRTQGSNLQDMSKNVSVVRMPQFYNFRLLFGLSEGQYAYRLVARVNHHGSELSSGHYTADIFDKDTYSWYSCNDKIVKKMSEFDATTKKGVIFIYQRLNQSTELSQQFEPVGKESLDFHQLLNYDDKPMETRRIVSISDSQTPETDGDDDTTSDTYSDGFTLNGKYMHTDKYDSTTSSIDRDTSNDKNGHIDIIDMDLDELLYFNNSATTSGPTTRVAPTRVAPTRVAPTRVAPTRVAPTRVAPNSRPTISGATTGRPTISGATTSRPTTSGAITRRPPISGSAYTKMVRKYSQSDDSDF